MSDCKIVSALALIFTFATTGHAQQVVSRQYVSTSQQQAAILANGGVNNEREPRTEVFTNSAIYITNSAGATIYTLDGLEQFEAMLSAGLPSNEIDARREVQRRVTGIGAAEIKRRTHSAAEGIVRAGQYGIDRVPAVVFDGHSVVYGVTDIKAARESYLRSARNTKK